MEKKFIYSLLALFIAGSLSAGCSKEGLGGAAAGALGTGAAYEYQAKRQMDKLEDDYNAGRIDKEEYERRKDQIGRGSIIY
ncbi:MAG: hypothetical protein SCH71_13405 [Desulfobulbaceae bacterium]|nr:hypothetical protein [Desulfobulbaceae bacterium]